MTLEVVWTGSLWRESYAPKPAPPIDIPVNVAHPMHRKSKELQARALEYFKKPRTAQDLAWALKWKQDSARRMCLKLLRAGKIERVGWVERIKAHGTPLTIYRATLKS